MDREALVAELPLPVGDNDAELGVLAIAVAIEDAFDVTLTDAEITLAELGTSEAVLRLLERHLGAA